MVMNTGQVESLSYPILPPFYCVEGCGGNILSNGGAWWPGSKYNDYRAKVMGCPGITSKAVERSDTPLPSTLPTAY